LLGETQPWPCKTEHTNDRTMSLSSANRMVRLDIGLLEQSGP
jgi:hypothetical protein